MNEEKDKILLIGDAFVQDVSLAELFKKSGFFTEVMPFDAASVKACDFGCYSAVVVDSRAVSEDPVKYLKECFLHCFAPLVILSENDDVINHVLALEMGADDFVVKPVDRRVLIARVKCIIRRGLKIKGSASEFVKYDGLYINRSKYLVERDGRRVKMPSKEFELLYLLATHPNRVFTREELLENVWGFDFSGKTRTIDVHIKRLRNKIEVASASWRIATVWSVGYKFESGAQSTDN
jgi:DNA-binding response OmpR family regulator